MQDMLRINKLRCLSLSCRLAYLRNISHCQPDAPHATDVPTDTWLPGPIKNRRLTTARRRALSLAAAAQAAVRGHPISVQEYDKL